jgi:hypothetical protein
MKRKAKNVTQPKKGVSIISLSMVGFFDILGFASWVENVQSGADLLKIANIVDSIRKRFEYRPKDQHVRELHHILGKQVLAFRDCIATAVSVHTEFFSNKGYSTPLVPKS